MKKKVTGVKKKFVEFYKSFKHFDKNSDRLTIERYDVRDHKRRLVFKHDRENLLKSYFLEKKKKKTYCVFFSPSNFLKKNFVLD